MSCKSFSMGTEPRGSSFIQQPVSGSLSMRMDVRGFNTSYCDYQYSAINRRSGIDELRISAPDEYRRAG